MDGEKWILKKLFYNSNIIINSIRGILVLDSNDIYLAAGSIFHWDGISSSVQLVYSRLNLPDPNATIEKLWGNSSSLIYGVGNAGTIVFYNGQNWQKIESGTTTNINDIWGMIEPTEGTLKILSATSGINNYKILTLNSSSVKDTLNWQINKSISGIWLDGIRTYASE